jgi:hypothetical protein
MSLALQEKPGVKFLEVDLSGKLSTQDYERFKSEFKALLHSQRKVRLLVRMHDFHGWTAGALWEEIKFDFKHFSDIERIVLVGDQKWEENMSKLCKPFTRAEVRFFSPSQVNEAQLWLES